MRLYTALSRRRTLGPTRLWKHQLPYCFEVATEAPASLLLWSCGSTGFLTALKLRKHRLPYMTALKLLRKHRLPYIAYYCQLLLILTCLSSSLKGMGGWARDCFIINAYVVNRNYMWQKVFIPSVYLYILWLPSAQYSNPLSFLPD